MNYQKQKREKIDKCNICCEVSDLTWDHVPPKKCYNDGRIYYNPLFGNLQKEEETTKQYLIAQSGIKYRTICSHCNNKLLGANYDLELKNFVDTLDNILNSSSPLPESTYIRCNANKIARAIVGHLLSAKKNFDGQTLVDKELRDYFLDETKTPPEDMMLLYRVYPFKSILIVRDIVLSKLEGNNYDLPEGLISCLSFYPTAFILSDGKQTCGHEDIFRYCTNNINDEAKIRIYINSYKYPNSNKIRDFLWPCNVSDSEDGTSFVMGGIHMRDSVLGFKK